MIKLKVEDYCQNCDMFEPESTSVIYEYGVVPELTIINTSVFCKNKDICQRMYDRLKAQES